MMPKDFPERNTLLGAPPGMTNCRPLPTFRDGVHVVSCWEPDEAERAAIAAGAPVWLVVYSGATQPPVSLSTLSPFVREPATGG
jgi:hypothetical protein